MIFIKFESREPKNAFTGFNEVENACFSDIENSETVSSLETGSSSGIDTKLSPV